MEVSMEKWVQGKEKNKAGGERIALQTETASERPNGKTRKSHFHLILLLLTSWKADLWHKCRRRLYSGGQWKVIPKNRRNDTTTLEKMHRGEYTAISPIQSLPYDPHSINLQICKFLLKSSIIYSHKCIPIMVKYVLNHMQKKISFISESYAMI